jgi:hypothetical protein
MQDCQRLTIPDPIVTFEAHLKAGLWRRMEEMGWDSE